MFSLYETGGVKLHNNSVSLPCDWPKVNANRIGDPAAFQAGETVDNESY